MKKSVDIIIPIYNAFEDLQKCINSVKKHTDLSTHRLILINDCSTDVRILPYIHGEERENIIVINNESNAGFSNNVNKGMLYSQDKDVILLNSDTVVTKNWVEKIIECAYSKPEIGTVTPMSNSATLCSYPIMCQDNDIPLNWTIDSLARVVERCSMKIYPRITVAVGFCMFIKRETINKVGLFDAETFERGYGEENDFCNRAEQLGYIHVMCDDTFIYHKGTVSFLSEQKKALIEAHDKILVERYPEQMKRNSLYCIANPDQYIRENINIYTKANPNKKNLMYVVHADFRKDAFDNMGGTQHHVRDLTIKLKQEYNVYVVSRDRDYLLVTMYSGEDRVSLKYYIGEKESFPRIHDTELFNLMKNLLCAFDINILHVHHVHGLSFDIFHVAKELDIPVVLTMHDYYYICPNVKLVNTQKSFCGNRCNEQECKNCLKENEGVYVSEGYLKNWRINSKKVFEICEKLIVPSEAAKKVYLEYYPEFERKFTVIEHGLSISEKKSRTLVENIRESLSLKYNFDELFTDENNPYRVRGWAYLVGINSENVTPILEVCCGEMTEYILCEKDIREDISNTSGNKGYVYSGFSCNVYKKEFLSNEVRIRILLKYKNITYTSGSYIVCKIIDTPKMQKYNVAFIGGMVPEKGSQKAYEMICNGSEDICWHVFGPIADNDLHMLKKDNLIKHGTYNQQDIPLLLKENDIDLVCIMSIWKETFCYTLSEAVDTKIPVVVTDIGAAGERVRRHGYGWIVSENMSGKEMAEYIYSILKDKNGYMEKKKVLENFKEKTLDEMSSEYIVLYSKYQSISKSEKTFDSKLIFKGLGIFDEKIYTSSILKNMSSNLDEVYEEMNRMTNLYNLYRNENMLIKNSKGYKLLEIIKNNSFIKVIRKIIRI